MKFSKTTLLVSALLAGIGTAHAAGTTLTVGMSSADAGKLDPHVATATADTGLLNWMFNGLVRIEPGKASPEFIEPDLAESWESSEDGLEWTFKLREGVQCHGEYGEFDAEDVVFSLERASDPEVSSFASEYAAFSSVKAVDPYTVRITLSEPVPSLLGLLVAYHGGNMVCKDAVEALGENFQRTPIGTGPFMFAEYQPQQYIRLVAHEDYFRGTPKLQEIIYRYIPSESSRDLAFQSGELDMLYGKQEQTWADSIRDLPDTTLVAMEPGQMSTIHLNKTMPPLDDLKVRKAVAHAINRAAMVEFKGSEVARPSISVVPQGYLGYTEDVPRYEYDPEIARKLLAEAGYPDGITLKAIHTTNNMMLSTMEVIQALLKEANINLELETVDHATFHSMIRDDLSQIVHYSAARFPIADVYLTQFYDSESIVGKPTAITNFSHCDTADDEIRAARVETDQERQLELWEKAQQDILEDVCAVPVYELLQLWAWKDNLDLGVDVIGSLNQSPPVTEKTHFTD